MSLFHRLLKQVVNLSCYTLEYVSIITLEYSPPLKSVSYYFIAAPESFVFLIPNFVQLSYSIEIERARKRKDNKFLVKSEKNFENKPWGYPWADRASFGLIFLV